MLLLLIETKNSIIFFYDTQIFSKLIQKNTKKEGCLSATFLKNTNEQLNSLYLSDDLPPFAFETTSSSILRGACA